MPGPSDRDRPTRPVGPVGPVGPARPTTVVRPKQRRAAPTVDALVEATIRALQEHGEAAFRVDDVLAETRTSKGSLYHHFTSRDGLIEAATLLEFSRQVDEDTAAIRAALDGAVDRADLLARLDAVNVATQSPERAPRHAGADPRDRRHPPGAVGGDRA